MNKILILACGALAREILALKAQYAWEHLDLHCLPAKLHLFPQDIPKAIEEAVGEYRAQYDEIYIGFADCGTGGGLERLAQKLNVQILPGAHCYAFYDGIAEFEKHSEKEITAFYLTDFLARQFDAFVWKPMGFDRNPKLIPMMFGNYEKLIYLAQSEDEELTQKAEDAAARLGLTFEKRFTGYGDLETRLKAWAIPHA